jgi:hypothetical protein
MFGRVLGTTSAQVARSIAFVLFPISFIALLAWATAGSATGNTGLQQCFFPIFHPIKPLSRFGI